MLRQELEQFLRETFQYDKFEDYCHNGLQVEGKEQIQKIAIGVSFNLPFVEEAIRANVDAMFVHHGIFGKDFFCLRGLLRQKVELLLHHDISLFGIHLPLDAHERYGNNAQLLSYIGAEIIETAEVGFMAENTQHHSLTHILDIFHQTLQPEGYTVTAFEQPLSSVLMPKHRHGFLYFDRGPEIPEKIVMISGGSARRYRSEELLAKGMDTYICGNVEEATPAWSYESHTNFVNLGHYWSEKPGPRAVQSLLEQHFDVETVFIEIENAL